MKMDCEEDYKILLEDKKTMSNKKLVEKYSLGILPATLHFRLKTYVETGKITDVDKKAKAERMPTRAEYAEMCRTMTRAEIISKCGIPNYYVTRLIKEHKTKPIRRKNGFREVRDIKKLCIEMIDDGYTNAEIAVKIRKSISYVSAVRRSLQPDPGEMPVYFSMPDDVRRVVTGSWVCAE